MNIVSYPVKHYTANRPYGIKRIVIHHMAGVNTAEGCANVLNKAGVSAHYGIGSDGIVGGYVKEENRAWACGDGIGKGSKGNDEGISIEVSNSSTGGDWPVADATFELLVELVKDIATRNNLSMVVGDTLIGHKDVKATACPGSLYARLQELADRVNEAQPVPPTPPVPTIKTYGMNYINNDAYIGKVAKFMRSIFPAYTDQRALGNYFGPYLTAAIKEFQKRTNLLVDGNFAENGETIQTLRKYGFKG